MSQQKEKEIRLHEGELNVMELLWSNKVLAAKDISKIIKEYIGWEYPPHVFGGLATANFAFLKNFYFVNKKLTTEELFELQKIIQNNQD